MDEKQDTANEPVDHQGNDFMDTGVLHDSTRVCPQHPQVTVAKGGACPECEA